MSDSISAAVTSTITSSSDINQSTSTQGGVGVGVGATTGNILNISSDVAALEANTDVTNYATNTLGSVATSALASATQQDVNNNAFAENILGQGLAVVQNSNDQVANLALQAQAASNQETNIALQLAEEASSNTLAIATNASNQTLGIATNAVNKTLQISANAAPQTTAAANEIANGEDSLNPSALSSSDKTEVILACVAGAAVIAFLIYKK